MYEWKEPSQRLPAAEISGMPLQSNGQMSADFFGSSPREQLKDKIGQMRRDMMHMQRALNVIEGKVRANTSAADMGSDFTLFYYWFLSAAESLFAMTWAAYDSGKVKAVIQDFQNKFSTFTTARSITLTRRTK
jgi:hypothetical protein